MPPTGGKNRLYLAVLAGIASGVVVGAAWPSVGEACKPLGDLFIRLIKMLIAPIVFCTVAGGIASAGDLKRVGRVGLKALVYFEVMTTFALIAGMLPVAIGMGEGGEFYRPMAVAIIGGTITSTLLTLLVIPTFYDSIEISRERAKAKFNARAAVMNPFFAFVITFAEAIATLLFLRFLYRLVMGRRNGGDRTPPSISSSRVISISC